MAQGPAVGVAVAKRGGITQGGGAAAGSFITSLRPDELQELQEYEKLLRFRDQVINGLHPSIKPPAHALGKVAQVLNPPTAPAASISISPSSAEPASANTGVNDNRPDINKLQSYQANMKMPAVNMTSLPGLGALPNLANKSAPSSAQKPNFNPVLLEKSDDLVKAEIRLQRQRLERGLQEQLEQSLSASKIYEQLAELDVADILAKALTLPEDVPAQSTDDVAANASASSDSFDDNTFYSSQHGTPESQMAHRLPNESENEEMRDGSPYEPQFDPDPVAQVAQVQQTRPPAKPAQPIPGVSTYLHRDQAKAAASATNFSIPAPVVVPGLSIGAMNPPGSYGQRSAPQNSTFQNSSVTRSDASGNIGNAQTSDTGNFSRVNERLLSQTMGRQQPSPLVRSHDLSPLAPQPERVSPLAPLAITRQQHLAGSDAVGRRATPAQVAALRKQTSNASSPESSPQGNKAAEKKKKKKRKADRLAAETSVASPHIKPEPRSPSPLADVPYARPNKRQRQSHQQSSSAFPYEETRYEQPVRVEEGYQERFQPRVVRQERVVGYERAGDYRPRHDEEPMLIASPRYERVYINDPRASVSGRPPHPDSPGAQPGQYVAREVRTVRDVSRVAENPYDVAGASYYRDVRTASRMGGHTAAYPNRSPSPPVTYERSAMPPPRALPRRIIIDEHGREYLEPAPPGSVIRDEIIGDPRGTPSERFFERLPPRAMSRRPEFIDDDVIYQSSSPIYGGPRRVFTQPQYSTSGPHSYRNAGIPNNSMPPPPSEYTPSRPQLDGGIPSDIPREYIARSASVRPPTDSVRYEIPTTYQRASMEERPREYYGAIRSASVRPAAESIRYEMPLTYERRIGGGMEEYVPLRSASVRPLERYEPSPGDYGSRGGGAYGGSSSFHALGRDGMQPPPPPLSAGERAYVREDDDVVFLDRRPMR